MIGLVDNLTAALAGGVGAVTEAHELRSFEFLLHRLSHLHSHEAQPVKAALRERGHALGGGACAIAQRCCDYIDEHLTVP
jgi:hypothetical protein